jgi:hypothetical protein
MTEIFQIAGQVVYTMLPYVTQPIEFILSVTGADGRGVDSLVSGNFRFAWPNSDEKVHITSFTERVDPGPQAIPLAGYYSVMIKPPHDPLVPDAEPLWYTNWYMLLISVQISHGEVTGNPQEVGGHVGKTFHVIDAQGQTIISFKARFAN